MPPNLGSDFVGGSYDIVFSGGSVLECATIGIITDSVIEDSEEFSVTLSIAAGGESFATVADGQARVVIERDPRTFGDWCDGRGGGIEMTREGWREVECDAIKGRR